MEKPKEEEKDREPIVCDISCMLYDKCRSNKNESNPSDKLVENKGA